MGAPETREIGRASARNACRVPARAPAVTTSASGEQVVVDATLDHQSEGGELVGADVKHFVRVTPVAHVQVTRVELAGKDFQVPDA